MISLSFLELVNEAWALKGFWTATIGFAAGAFFMLAMDMSLPHIRFGEREARNGQGLKVKDADLPLRPDRHRHRRFRKHEITDTPLYMSGILLAIGITVHNVPEGIAVGAGYMHTPKFGVFIAMAILMHNIPEGIATALPLYKSGMTKLDAVKVALFSGLAEPVGAIGATLLLGTFESLIPASLAFAGGVMMFITLDELIPAAREHGHQHYTAVGIILGSIFVFLLSGLFGV
jgi:ZIP family zinc transporter